MNRMFPIAVILAAVILNGREFYYIGKYTVADIKNRKRRY